MARFIGYQANEGESGRLDNKETLCLEIRGWNTALWGRSLNLPECKDCRVDHVK